MENAKIQFDVKDATERCIQWIRDWFQTNGKDCKAVIGISGGKDSTIAAALCVKALGKDRVFGVLMPNGEQSDIGIAKHVCRWLNIESVVININDSCQAIHSQLNKNGIIPSEQTSTNLPARIRMSTLYAVSQSVNGRVINTCNYSEDYIGYSTRYGDSVGDMSPLSHFTVQEVKAIAYYIELPEHFIEKEPSDGLCGKTDEENLGFTYEVLDAYIRDGKEPNTEIKEKIDFLHRKNAFKLKLMPSFDYWKSERK